MKIAAIRAARPGDVLKDLQVPGLQLRTFAGSRSFYFYYRNSAGNQRRPKLGTWPTMSLEQARGAARAMQGKIFAGADPSAQRAADRTAETLAALCDRWLRDYAEPRKAPRSIKDDRRQIERILKPRFGREPAAGITADTLHRMRRQMADRPVAFNRVVTLLSTILNFARLPNPTRDVPRFSETGRRRYLEPDEYARLAAALDKIESEYPHAIGAIRVILLTGARSGEILGARRDQLRDGVLTLQRHKTASTTGDKQIVLPAAALAVIDALPVVSPALVGISTRPTKAWNAVLAAAAITNLTIHDLRHNFASEMLDAGYTLAQIGEIFGHASPTTTKRYAHLQDERRRATAADMGARISGRLAI